MVPVLRILYLLRYGCGQRPTGAKTELLSWHHSRVHCVQFHKVLLLFV